MNTSISIGLLITPLQFLNLDVQISNVVPRLISLFDELRNDSERCIVLIEGVGELLSSFVKMFLQIE